MLTDVCVAAAKRGLLSCIKSDSSRRGATELSTAPTSRANNGAKYEQGSSNHRHRQCCPNPGRLVQRRTRQPAGPRSRQDCHQGGARARARRGRRGLRGHHGADPRRRCRPEPGAAGVDRRRHSRRCAGLGHEPAVRLRAARRGAGRPADRARLLQGRGRRRHGEHEPGAALRASARRHQDGRHEVHRHHDQGRPVGRLQRLSHGQHRRERGAPVADHARGAGSLRGCLAEQGRGRQEGRQVQGRDRSRSPSRRARARRSSPRTSTSRTA